MLVALANKNCSLQSGFYQCSCTAANDPTYPTLVMEMGTSSQTLHLEITPSLYLSYDVVKKNCTLMIGGSSQLGSFVLLGDPIIRAFTIAHDVDNLKMGFIAKTGATVSVQNTKSFSSFIIMSYIAILSTIGLVFLMWFWSIYC